MTSTTTAQSGRPHHLPGTTTPATRPVLTADPDLDEHLRSSVLAATRGAADLGEVLALAHRIDPDDLGSWREEWEAAADRSAERAASSAKAGDVVGARRARLRAAEYYRQACFFLRTDLGDPELHRLQACHQSEFRAAMALMTHQTEVVSLDLDDVAIRGYLFTPDRTVNPRPTIIAPTGYDTTAESLYAGIAVPALERGLSCLVLEGPGQGSVLLELGLPLRPDYEAVLTPAVDWLLTRSGVDAERLVLLGRDLAGHLAPRAAAYEPRLAALVCDPAQPDLAATIRRNVGAESWARALADDASVEVELEHLASTPYRRNVVRRRMLAHGATSVRGLLRELDRFTMLDDAPRIGCPTLAVAGEGDFAGTSQLHLFAQALTAPVSTHVFSSADGAGGRCEGLGQDRFDEFVHGWLMRRLRGRTPTTP
jgi:hypothetical protein